MLEVRYRPRAELDIHSAVLYLGEVLGNPVAARKLYETLVEAIEHRDTCMAEQIMVSGELISGYSVKRREK